jgi:hypothetical protein
MALKRRVDASKDDEAKAELREAVGRLQKELDAHKKARAPEDRSPGGAAASS